MDGIVESGVLVQLGPYGVAVMALFACYFLWQRQSDQFGEVKERLDNVMTLLRQDIKSSDEKAAQAMAGVQSVRETSTAGLKAMADAHATFVTHISETRPTREEMHDSIDRVVQSVERVIKPLADDMTTIKNALIKVPGGR